MALLSLVDDCHGLILGQLAVEDLARMSQVNRRLRDLVNQKTDYGKVRSKLEKWMSPQKKFRRLYQTNSIELAKKFCRDHADNMSEDSFVRCCTKGHLEMAQWLQGLKQSSYSDNIYQRCFYYSFANSNVELKTWLWTFLVSPLNLQWIFESKIQDVASLDWLLAQAESVGQSIDLRCNRSYLRRHYLANRVDVLARLVQLDASLELQPSEMYTPVATWTPISANYRFEGC